MENNTRKIRLKLLSQTKIETIETNARTYGELVSLIESDSELNSKVFSGGDDIIMIDRDTKVEYGNIDNAILPATDCIMFIQPAKTKSGCDFEFSSSEISNMNYNEIRSYGSKLNKTFNANIDLSGNTAEVKGKVFSYLISQESVTENNLEKEANEKFSQIKEVLSSGKEYISTAASLLQELEDSIMNLSNAGVIDIVTEDSLDEEYINLMESYKN